MSTPVTDPRNSPYCWSAAEVGTPDGTIRELACGRRRHRWGRHTNRHVTWKCPKRCACVRHANRTPALAQPGDQEGTTNPPRCAQHGHIDCCTCGPAPTWPT